MEEENLKSDGKSEEKETAQDQPKETVEDSDLGNAPEEKKPNMIEEAKKAAEDLRNATAAQKAENDRRERLAAESEFGGQAKMSAPVKPKKLTDREYAQALDRGEVNPLKEDKFV